MEDIYVLDKNINKFRLKTIEGIVNLEKDIKKSL